MILNNLDITGDLIFNSLDIISYVGLYFLFRLFYKQVIKEVLWSPGITAPQKNKIQINWLIYDY